MPKKKVIVVSAVNLTEGGPLTILRNCLYQLSLYYGEEYQIIAIVHHKSLCEFAGIEYIEMPQSKRSWIIRLYLEYVYFKKLSQQLTPYLWLSLHDITPNVKSQKRVVYCHNSSPFCKFQFKYFYFDPTFGLFNLFYKLLYKINLNKNTHIVVQQDWLRNIFQQQLNAKPNIIVAPPLKQQMIEDKGESSKHIDSDKVTFFYPCLPRVFKNIELICKASQRLSQKGLEFNVIITIDGKENRYSAKILEKYKNISEINYAGLLTHEEIIAIYPKCQALIFPSKLESWGLPVTEAKYFNIPVLLANLPYAHETVGDYEKVSFFNPDNDLELSDLMEAIITKTVIFQGNRSRQILPPVATNWKDLFDIILQNDKAI